MRFLCPYRIIKIERFSAGGISMKQQSFHLKVHGFGLSGASFFYTSFIFTVLSVLWLLTLLLLGYFFPALTQYELLVSMPYLIVMFILLVHACASFVTVTLDEKEIRVFYFGIPIRKIPVSQLRLFCAVGNGMENILCLTTHGIEEMAAWQEKKLLRNCFAKYDVPFIKKKSNWQDVLAQKYLSGLRKSPWGVFKDRDVVFLGMQPVLQVLIRVMYPQLPYKNYTEIKSTSKSTYLPKNMIPCFALQAALYYTTIQEDGIHISTKKKPISHIAAQSVKTVVRVDIFKNYERNWPDHIPMLFVSTLSAEELAAKAPQTMFSESTDAFPNKRALLAYAYASRAAMRWRVKYQDCCPLPCTQTFMTQLRECCPQAEWIDLSESWLNDHTV